MTDLEPFAVPAPPDRPDPDELIMSAWGRWVQDRQSAAAVQLLATRSTNYAVPSDATFVTVPWEAVPINVGGSWQAASNAWKAPRDGTIEVGIAAQLVTPSASAGGGNMIVAAYVDAVEYRIGQVTCTGLSAFNAAGTQRIGVSANQLITAKVYFGAFAGITKNVGVSRMTIRYIE